MIKGSRIKVILIFIITFILLLGIMITSRVTKTYSLQSGDIAKEDIEATREVTDQKSTEILKNDSINAVALQYSKRTDVITKLVNEINSMINEANQLKDTNNDEKAKLDKFKNDINTGISDSDIKTLIGFPKDDLKSLQNFLVETMTSFYDTNNVDADTTDISKATKDSIKKVNDFVIIALNSSTDAAKFSKELKNIGINIANSEIKPNFFYDKDKTEQLKKDAEKKVAPVVIKKDQIIVKKGEPVTSIQISILKDLGLLNNNNKFDWYIYAVLAGLVLLVISLQWYYLYKYHEEVLRMLLN